MDLVAPTSYLAALDATDFTRIAVTFTAPAGCTSIGVYPLRDAREPVDAVLWGAKLEVGESATPYGSLEP